MVLFASDFEVQNLVFNLNSTFGKQQVFSPAFSASEFSSMILNEKLISPTIQELPHWMIPLYLGVIVRIFLQVLQGWLSFQGMLFLIPLTSCLFSVIWKARSVFLTLKLARARSQYSISWYEYYFAEVGYIISPWYLLIISTNSYCHSFSSWNCHVWLSINIYHLSLLVITVTGLMYRSFSPPYTM